MANVIPSEEIDPEDMLPIHELGGQRTNDLWFAKYTNSQDAPTNYKVIVCGLCSLVLILLLVSLAIWQIEGDMFATKYNHDKVRVAPYSETTCSFHRNCTEACEGNIRVEQEIGCCSGCPLTSDCNFHLQVTWATVKEQPQRQRIWILVSTDGKDFFQTGWGAYVTNSSGKAVVKNACLSGPNQQVIITACLSRVNFLDQNFVGFPHKWCDSTYGVCVNTNGVYVEELDSCVDGQWEGNFFDTSWDGPTWSASERIGSSYSLLFAISLLFGFQVLL